MPNSVNPLSVGDLLPNNVETDATNQVTNDINEVNNDEIIDVSDSDSENDDKYADLFMPDSVVNEVIHGVVSIAVWIQFNQLTSNLFEGQIFLFNP